MPRRPPPNGRGSASRVLVLAGCGAQPARPDGRAQLRDPSLVLTAGPAAPVGPAAAEEGGDEHQPRPDEPVVQAVRGQRGTHPRLAVPSTWTAGGLARSGCWRAPPAIRLGWHAWRRCGSYVRTAPAAPACAASPRDSRGRPTSP